MFIFPQGQNVSGCMRTQRVNFLTKRALLNNLCLKSFLVISAGFSSLSCPYTHSLSAQWILMQVLHRAVRRTFSSLLSDSWKTAVWGLDRWLLSLSFCWRKQKGSFKRTLSEPFQNQHNSVSSLSFKTISPKPPSPFLSHLSLTHFSLRHFLASSPWP